MINIRHPGQLKNENPGIQPIYLKTGPNWQYLQCCLAGSSKTALRILIFSIAMGAEYSSYVKSIATFALTFFGYIILVLASVQWDIFGG